MASFLVVATSCILAGLITRGPGLGKLPIRLFPWSIAPSTLIFTFMQSFYPTTMRANKHAHTDAPVAPAIHLDDFADHIDMLGDNVEVDM
jgi:hypothetical protein